MRVVGDKQIGTIGPEFDRSISIDFQGAKITSDTGFLLMREIVLHMIRDTAFWGESVKPSIDSVIRRLVKVGAGVSTMRGDGTSMLHRLFHSPGTIGFYSPEPLKADG